MKTPSRRRQDQELYQPKGRCYVIAFAERNSLPGALLVHGSVGAAGLIKLVEQELKKLTPEEWAEASDLMKLVGRGCRFSGQDSQGRKEPHAWVENEECVLDPHVGHVVPKELYDSTVQPERHATFTGREALLAFLREKHYGPWPAGAGDWDAPPPRRRKGGRSKARGTMPESPR